MIALSDSNGSIDDPEGIKLDTIKRLKKVERRHIKNYFNDASIRLGQRTAKGVYFHPDAAGVAFSRTPYPWKQGMNRFRGLVRLVCGLGTRAVDRHKNDYARLISFEDPGAFPWLKHGQERPPTQRLFDTLNLEKRIFETIPLSQWAATNLEAKLSLFGEPDHHAAARLQAAGWNEVPWILDFRRFVERKKEIQDLEQIVSVLDAAYGAPVDREFTLNDDEALNHKINVLQGRRLPTYRASQPSMQEARPKRLELFRTSLFFGPPDPQDLDVIVRVAPPTYVAMTEAQRHDAARQLGKVFRTLKLAGNNVLLSGPAAGEVALRVSGFRWALGKSLACGS